MATPETGELGLTATIPFIDIATAPTLPATVPWVYKDHWDTSTMRLIDDKLSQLPKAPSTMLVALAFANRRPVADARQVFQGKRSLRVFGMGDKLCRDVVVHPPAKTRLLSRHLSQTAFGLFRTPRLEGLAVGLTALSDRFNGITRVGMGVRIHGKIHDPELDPQKAIRNHRWFFRGFQRHQEIEDAFEQDQIGLAFGPMELDSLVV